MKSLSAEMFDIELVEVWKTDLTSQNELLAIRIEPSIRRNMFTDHVIQEDEHRQWIASLETSATARYFSAFRRGKVIGGIGLSAINLEHRRAEWGYYVSPSCRGLTSCALEVNFLDYVFSTGEFDKLNAEVIAWNASTLKLNKRFGFIVEGVRRSNILRDGARHDVILIGITKTEWEMARTRLVDGTLAGRDAA